MTLIGNSNSEQLGSVSAEDVLATVLKNQQKIIRFLGFIALLLRYAQAFGREEGTLSCALRHG
jgi:hypothetical protein